VGDRFQGPVASLFMDRAMASRSRAAPCSEALTDDDTKRNTRLMHRPQDPRGATTDAAAID